MEVLVELPCFALFLKAFLVSSPPGVAPPKQCVPLEATSPRTWGTGHHDKGVSFLGIAQMVSVRKGWATTRVYRGVKWKDGGPS